MAIKCWFVNAPAVKVFVTNMCALCPEERITGLFAKFDESNERPITVVFNVNLIQHEETPFVFEL